MLGYSDRKSNSRVSISLAHLILLSRCRLRKFVVDSRSGTSSCRGNAKICEVEARMKLRQLLSLSKRRERRHVACRRAESADSCVGLTERKLENVQVKSHDSSLLTRCGDF